MPDIRWEIDPVFRREFAAELARWDFRQGPKLYIKFPDNPFRPEPVATDTPSEIVTPPVVLQVNVEVMVEGGKTHRVFVVQPATVNDRKRIAEWVEKRRVSRAWLREDMA